MSSGELDAWQRAEFARLCSTIRRLRHGFYHDGNYVRERKPLTQIEKEFNAADIESYLKEAEDIRTVFADEVERQDRALIDHGALWAAPAPGFGDPYYRTGALSLEMQTDLFMVDYVRGFMRGLEGAYTSQTSRKDRIDGICRYIKSLDDANDEVDLKDLGQDKVRKEQLDDGMMNSRCGATREADAPGGNGDQEMDPDWGKSYQWNSQGWGMGDFEVDPCAGSQISQVWTKPYQDSEPEPSSRPSRTTLNTPELNPTSRRSADHAVPARHSNNSLHAIDRYPKSPLFTSVCTESIWHDSAARSRTKAERQPVGVGRVEPVTYTHDTVPILNQIYPTRDKLTVQESIRTPAGGRSGPSDVPRQPPPRRDWPTRLEKPVHEARINHNVEAAANGQSHQYRQAAGAASIQPVNGNRESSTGRKLYETEKTPGIIHILSKNLVDIQLNGERSLPEFTGVMEKSAIASAALQAENRWIADHSAPYAVRSVRHGVLRRDAIDELDKIPMITRHKLDPRAYDDYGGMQTLERS